jgi:hypothetical protein
MEQSQWRMRRGRLDEEENFGAALLRLAAGFCPVIISLVLSQSSHFFQLIQYSVEQRLPGTMSCSSAASS